ncbi:DUF433 domain-containing protein [Parafrankia sp. BMG5.11]|uniref:DUF433 domain-containing protein n=1 Tax=Parafrankia sp. BMG5.11 TaxID=222540 RepID=UPI00103F5FF6|nr:DUF433 domain-containing protein [Parafrankia sp. BMG5.11]TCJ32291.1 DUF433 domain-containing protein [Parafrankia sp. BMG5.11]
MPIDDRLYATAEVAALTDIPYGIVANALYKRSIIPTPRSDAIAPGTKRKVSREVMLRLKLWNETGFAPAQLRALSNSIDIEPAADLVEVGTILIVNVGKARRHLDARISELAAAEALVVPGHGVLNDEPVFEGTDTPVRFIAKMLDNGESKADILKKHDKLTLAHLGFAQLWAAAHPHHGRPRSFKQLSASANLTS